MQLKLYGLKEEMLNMLSTTNKKKTRERLITPYFNHRIPCRINSNWARGVKIDESHSDYALRGTSLCSGKEALLWLQSDLSESSIPIDIMTKLIEGNAKENGAVTALKVLVIMVRSRHDRIEEDIHSDFDRVIYPQWTW